MPRCAFLTMESLEGFVSDDELVHEPLARRGWTVERVPWRRRGVTWSRYEVVVIRTTWDYPDDPDGFLRALEAVHRSSALLLNPLELVRWNLEKTYLRDLEARGVPIVPTLWGRNLSRDRIARIRDRLRTDRLVVKPTIGANASRLHRLEAEDEAAEERAIRELGDRAYMAQPFVPGVVEEGEHSLFYFGGEHSHTVLKRPRTADFRVQEEHGGRIGAVQAGPELLEAGRRAMEAVDPTPLYARVDLVPLDGIGYAVMELELVEPALYFRMDPDAAERFAVAFQARMRGSDHGAGRGERSAGARNG